MSKPRRYRCLRIPPWPCDPFAKQRLRAQHRHRRCDRRLAPGKERDSTLPHSFHRSAHRGEKFLSPANDEKLLAIRGSDWKVGEGPKSPPRRGSSTRKSSTWTSPLQRPTPSSSTKSRPPRDGHSELVCPASSRHPSPAQPLGYTIRHAGEELSQPYTERWSFGFQRQLRGTRWWMSPTSARKSTG